MSHEVTIGDLRPSRWNMPDFDTVWRGLDPAQVNRFIRDIHADVAQAISGYEAALAVAEEERTRLQAELEQLREADAVSVEADAVPAADAEPAADARPPAWRRRAQTAAATA